MNQSQANIFVALTEARYIVGKGYTTLTTSTQPLNKYFHQGDIPYKILALHSRTFSLSTPIHQVGIIRYTFATSYTGPQPGIDISTQLS